MKKNRFVVITTCHNVAKWLRMNLAMMKYQSYKNFICILVNDNSNDSIHTVINSMDLDDRFIILDNPNFGSQGKAFFHAVEYMNNNNFYQDDIIVEVDGDDWLASPYVLEYLNGVYQDTTKKWMTYGQYQIYPSSNLGGHYYMPKNNTDTVRNEPLSFSHLKTYKKFLLDKVTLEDVTDKETGEIFNAAWDHALCIPMLEMCSNENVHKIDEILYSLNRSDELENEGKTRINTQKEVEQKIRLKDKKNKIQMITTKLVDPYLANNSLGNQMFQIAAAVSLAKDMNNIAVFPDLLTDGRGDYRNNIFKHVLTYPDKSFIKHSYKEKKFSFDAIPYLDNLELQGYFQSEKYFEHNREEIVKLFGPSKEYLEKHSYMGRQLTCSVHVRRGDYVNLQEYHPLCTLEYYKKAIYKIFHSITRPVVFFVFSDDIQWCKENFTTENFPDINFKFIEGQSDYEDIWLMSMCDCNIIANSSFSWWGAWLNTRNDKVVIAPTKWFGEKRQLDDSDIIPNYWIKI